MYISNSEEFSTVDGAVLIFLPGLADIQEVYELLQSDRKFSDTKRYGQLKHFRHLKFFIRLKIIA